jgi:hypothetical protein
METALELNPADRRKHKRVPTSIEVSIRHPVRKSLVLEATIRDISKGGAFLTGTLSFFKQGQKVTIEQPETGMKILAEIRWVATSGPKKGIGVLFLEQQVSV